MIRPAWARFIATAALGAVVACNGGGGNNGGGDGDGGGSTSGGGTGYVNVTGISPDHGPLAGGNTVLVSGSGFLGANATPNMLLLGGRLVEKVSVLSDTEIQVVVPPGMQPGTVSATVFNNNGYAEIKDAYAYNPLPTITKVDPAVGDYKGGDTITLTGTGFQSLEAGTNRVWIDGNEAVVKSVASDKSMTVTTPAGTPLRLVDVTMSNDNGAGGLPKSFHYTASGFLSFGNDSPPNGGAIFLIDPSDASVTQVLPAFGPRIVAATVLPDSSILMMSQSGYLYQRSLDGTMTQTLLSGCINGRLQSIASGNGKVYGICRGNPTNTQFGTVDPATGVFTPIGGASDNWGQPSLTFDSGTLYLLQGGSWYTLDPTTGARTLVIALDQAGRSRGVVLYNDVGYYINYTSTGGKGVSNGGSGFVRSFDPSDGTTADVVYVPVAIHGLTLVP